MSSITEPKTADMDGGIGIIKDLLRKSMKKEWQEVVKIYREHPMVHMAKINRSGDTALHIAVSAGEGDIVKELVGIIQDSNEAELQKAASDDQEDIVEERVGIVIQDSNEADTPQQLERKKRKAKEVLEIKNEQGNTPLHLAALIGSGWMCDFFAKVDPSLVVARNDENETPFFLAALYGHKEAFFCLHNIICDTDKRYDYCTRNDGDTILHCAIDGDYFDLAFLIIHLYPDLVHCVNERGFFPLHRLASNANAFRSGSDLGICSKIIYHCVFVDEFKPSLDQQSTFQSQCKYGKKFYRRPGFFRNFTDLTEEIFAEFRIIFEMFVDFVRTDLPHIRSVDTCSEYVDTCFDTVQLLFIAVLMTGKKDKSRNTKGETAILIAAKNGVTEMVVEILERFPEATHDMNTDKKNVVLLAVENRQPHVYDLLLESNTVDDEIFERVDNEGNNVIHLALKLGDISWQIPGPALQLQWEIKWVEFVLNSVPSHFCHSDNNEGKNPWDIFAETHKELLEKGGQWLNDMSQSCSVVAGLLVTVAYSTSTTVPGGVIQDKGTPVLEHYPTFEYFAIFSLIAFYSSLCAVVMFLSILTSGYHVKDFRKAVFIKLLLGLTAFYVSIASTLASFTAGHYFILKDKLKKSAASVYIGTCLVVTLFAIAQFPIYIKLLWATFKKVPDRSHRTELQYAAPPMDIFRGFRR